MAHLLSSDTFALNASLWDHGMLCKVRRCLSMAVCTELKVNPWDVCDVSCIAWAYGHPSRLDACIGICVEIYAYSGRPKRSKRSELLH
jgi:hypothetical protein